MGQNHRPSRRAGAKGESIVMLILTILAAVGAALVLGHWLRMAYGMVRAQRVPHLPDLTPAEPAAWPRVSIVVAACNEADRIEPAARTLLALDYPDLELILVNDRSTDGTGAIIDRLAADPRVRPLHITDLPAGWLGKVHALDRGLKASTGEYVLFTDADVHFQPSVLRKTVAYMLEHQLDHLAGLPQLYPTSLLLDSAIGAFIRQFLLITRVWNVGRPGSDAYIGIGAFNLVRRAAMEASDGFEWLRLEAADDMGLGLLMKRSGARGGVVTGGGLMGIQWYRSWTEVAQGAEKGYATALQFSLGRAVLGAVMLPFVELGPLVMLPALATESFRFVGWMGLAAVAAWLVTGLAMKRWARSPRLAPFLLGPLTTPILAVLLLRAGILGHRRGGVLWRGTLYPTEVLRPGSRVRFP